MNVQLRNLLGAVAPTLAAALGGPLAGVATRAIGEKLMGRTDAGFDEVVTAVLTATTGDLAKLKELEYQFRTDMENAGIEIERIAADDRKSARERQARMRDWTPSIMGLAIIVGFFSLLSYLIQFGLPVQGGEVLIVLVGALATMVAQVSNYFFGSSTGSKAKDALIADLKGALK